MAYAMVRHRKTLVDSAATATFGAMPKLRESLAFLSQGST
jgi:hypothetical protein